MTQTLTAIFMPDLGALGLRAPEATDVDFLFELYASTRMAEVMAWGWPEAQRQSFLQMQFRAQEVAYRARFPKSDRLLIVLSDRPIGLIWVARNPAEIYLIWLALLPEYQNQGMGSRLLQGLQAEAASTHCPIRLQVLKFNPAIRFYQRLGFVAVEATDTHWQLEWQPPASHT